MVAANGLASEFELVTAPDGAVVALADLKRHLKVDADDRDDDITAFESAAVDRIEQDNRRQLRTATWRAFWPGFESPLCLRKCPVQSITSITYRDVDGNSQTLSTDVYELFATREPAEIHLKPNQSWPLTQTHEQAVTVTFVAGYGDAADVPSVLQSAIKLIVEGMFYGCEDKLEPAVQRLIDLKRWGM